MNHNQKNTETESSKIHTYQAKYTDNERAYRLQTEGDRDRDRDGDGNGDEGLGFLDCTSEMREQVSVRRPTAMAQEWEERPEIPTCEGG